MTEDLTQDNLDLKEKFCEVLVRYKPEIIPLIADLLMKNWGLPDKIIKKVKSKKFDKK